MISPGRAALSRAVCLIKRANKTFNITTVRNSSAHPVRYRVAPADPPQLSIRCAEGLGALFWWWVLWHLYTEPGHVFGEFAYPDPSVWTDEELGVE